MDKVKQIFSSDSSTKGTHSTTSPTHTGNSAHSTNIGSATPGIAGTTGLTGDSTAHSHGVGSHGTGSKVVDDVTSGTTSTRSSGIGHSHTHGHEDRHHSLDGVKNATHDHKHLAAVQKDTHHTHETEEVQREREHDRHIHHVQHHVQPVLDSKHHETQHATTAHPVTHVREQHVNTDEDKKLFAGLGAPHKDTQITGGHERQVVDKGEIVNENLHHHVHHVVQPVVETDHHHHKTIHTTIPVKHTTHEAPIVHQSSTHEPMNIKDFVSQGGDLKSKLTHDNAGVLATGDCARDVDGPAEQLAEKLHLTSGSHAGHSHAH